MLRKLALLAVALVAIAQPLAVYAGDLQSPSICDDIIPPTSLKSRPGEQPPDEEDPGCPVAEGRSRPPYIWVPPPPCVPDPLTGICKLDE